MLTRTFWSGDIQAVRRAYSVLRAINVAGGLALEPQERVSLLTIPAGLRAFCLLNHVDAESLPILEAALTAVGLSCGVCKATFDYELDVDAPSDVIAAYREFQARRPLFGLGVAKSRVDLAGLSIGAALGYPKCCCDMDDRTKSYDQSAALRFLIERNHGNFAAVRAELETGLAHPIPETDMREEWNRRFDLTHVRFPFALHTACDDCLNAGDDSPSGILSRRYETMVRTTVPELYEAVLRQNEIFRLTSDYPS